MPENSGDGRPARKSPALRGLRELLVRRPRNLESVDVAGMASLAIFGPAPKMAAGNRGGDLATFLKKVELFEELGDADLKRLSRIAHERSYRDGEYIYEQGKPGIALFVMRSGIVEITRRREDGEELILATLEPPASFEELAAMGCEIVRWTSARARGPVTVVALGRPDLDALSQNAPLLANKLLRRLAEVTARRLQLLVEIQLSEEGEQGTADGGEKKPQPG